MSIFGKKYQFWAKFGLFRAKNPFFGGRHLFRVKNIDRCGSNWPLETKMCNFFPQNLDIWAKNIFFVLESRFLSTGYVTSIPGAILYLYFLYFIYLDHPPLRKNSCFIAMGYFLGLILVIGHFGLSHLASSISTLNFGPPSMKLGGTHTDNGHGPGQITEKQPFLRLAKEWFFGQKSVFSNKKTPEIC